MSPKDALFHSQCGDGSDEVSDSGSDPEEIPMIEKRSSSPSRKLNGRASTLVAILSLLFLASLVGNVFLLWHSLHQDQDLDTICVKHTSEYCE